MHLVGFTILAYYDARSTKHKLKVVLLRYKYSVPPSQRTHCVSIAKTKEYIFVDCDNRTEYKHAVWTKKQSFILIYSSWYKY
jgi:hypothetical protein